MDRPLLRLIHLNRLSQEVGPPLFKTIGVDGSLAMLPPLRKPIKVATIHNIIRERKLGAAPAPSGGVSLKDALAKKTVNFFYQPKFDLKTTLVVGAEVVARVAHPQLGLPTPDQFLKGADPEALLSLSRLALVSALKDRDGNAGDLTADWNDRDHDAVATVKGTIGKQAVDATMPAP